MLGLAPRRGRAASPWAAAVAAALAPAVGWLALMRGSPSCRVLHRPTAARPRESTRETVTAGPAAAFASARMLSQRNRSPILGAQAATRASQVP